MYTRARSTIAITLTVCCAAVVLVGCRDTVVGQGAVETLTATTSTPTTSAPTATSTASATGTGTGTTGGSASSSMSGGATSTAGSATLGGTTTGVVGDTVSAGQWTLRVLGTEFVTTIKGMKVPEGQALRVTAQVMNPTQNATSLLSSLVLKAGGKAVAPSMKGGPALVPAAQTANVTVYFPIKKQGGGYQLIFSEPGGGSMAMVKID